MKQVEAVYKYHCDGCYYFENKIDCLEIKCSDDKIWVRENEK